MTQQPELLSDWALIGLSGPQSQEFAQSQLTSDVVQLSNNDAQVRKNPGQPTAYCEPKGRVIANGYLFRPASQIYFLAVHASLSEVLMQRLKMYRLRSKVEIELITDHQLVGYSPADIIASGCAITPGSETLQLDIAQSNDLGDSLSHTLWPEAAVRAGVVLIEAATSEQFTPQMINLDEIGAVSFSKGCYPGQEIVARTHYLGKVKRRLCRVQITSHSVPEIGARIVDPKGSPAGALLNFVPQTGGYVGLAVVYDSARAHEALQLDGGSGTLVVKEALRD